MVKYVFLFLFLLTSLFSEDKLPDKDIPTLILFDCSKSMLQKFDDTPKIELSRQSIKSWSKKLIGRKNISVRFFANGESKDSFKNCMSSNIIIPFNKEITKSDTDNLYKKLQATGLKTNIAYALKQAKDDLKDKTGAKIVLISDGLENCEGDPVEMAKELKKMDIKIDVLALGDPEKLGGLGKLSLITGGSFDIANDAQSLKMKMSNSLPNIDFPQMDMDLKNNLPAKGAVPAVPAPPVKPMKITTVNVSDKKPKPIAIEIILDASGSMKAKINNKKKMLIAKEALKNTLVSLKDPVFKVGLRAYGFDDSIPKTKEDSCPNTELLTKITNNNLREINKKAYSLKAYGYTPIAKSLELAGEDLKNTQAGNRLIILITDGKETCGGDPKKVAKKLCEMGINMETHIIGFDLDTKTAEQMKEIAKAGCGTYNDAKNSTELKKAINTTLKEAKKKIDPKWLRTIKPIEGGKTPQEAVEILSGTYTLTRNLKKGEAMYFFVPTKVAQHGLLRGLIQSRRLVRENSTLKESKSGIAEFFINILPPKTSKKKKARSIFLTGEPGTYMSIGHLDTKGDGFVFSISGKYDTVHADSLFNLDIREAGDIEEGYEAPKSIDEAKKVIPANKKVYGHIGEGDFVDIYKLPKNSSKIGIKMTNKKIKYRVSLLKQSGKKITRSATVSKDISVDIPQEAIYLKIEDRTPKLKQEFTSYEIFIK